MNPLLAPDPSGAQLFFSRISLVTFLFILSPYYTTVPASSQPQTPPGMVYIPEGYFQMGHIP